MPPGSGEPPPTAQDCLPMTEQSPRNDNPNEQSEAERLATSRRYRRQRTDELHALVAPHLDGEVVECGQFSRLPLEALAAIPVFGVFFAIYARIRGRRSGGSSEALLALDRDHLYVLDYGLTDSSGRRPVSVASRVPRSSVTVRSVRNTFMRDRVELELGDSEKDLVLYASTLKTNPWASGLIRALGGDAPEPMDLSAPTDD